MDDKDLELNFADFCFDHFQHHNDNIKEDQYKTPQGSKDGSPNGNESESIEVVETPSNTYPGPLQESTISSASSNNTDICVLDSHFTSDDLEFLPNQKDNEPINNGVNDKFAESEESDEVFLRAADVIDKDEDFTILHKPTKTRRLCDFEESTEVLMLINSEYQDQCKPTYSGTDSDVEVLMSEEFVESDWSSGNGFEDDSPKTAPLTEKTPNNLRNDLPHSEEELTSTSGLLQQSCERDSLKTQASTDLDISVEGVLGANDDYQNLTRTQLLQVIRKQELYIRVLEQTVKRYEEAQHRLFEKVDALRLELRKIGISSLRNSEQVKNV